MKLKDPRTIAVVTSSALVLLLGALVVQHLRHGWPFSAHHGIGVPLPRARVATRDGGSIPTTHPRGEVEIAQEQLVSCPRNTHD